MVMFRPTTGPNMARMPLELVIQMALCLWALFMASQVAYLFIDGKNTDAQILSCAYGYEQNSLGLSAPRHLKNAEAIESVAKTMDRMSDSHQ
jgi:hypothetical protein